MTPGALVLLLWEGSAAAGLTIEYGLLPRSEKMQEALSNAARARGPTFAASVLIGVWCTLGPILLVLSTIPKIIIHTVGPAARHFNEWADAKAAQWHLEAEEMRKRGAAEREALRAWSEFSLYAMRRFRTAKCSKCGGYWPVGEDVHGHTLQSHPGQDLLECPGSGGRPVSYTLQPRVLP